MKEIVVLFLLISALQFGQDLRAQNKETEITDLTNNIFTARQISNDLLPKYSWTSRTEILKSREILNIMIENNRLDQQGHLVQKVLNEQGAKMPKAFLIREIAESENENVEDIFHSTSRIEVSTRFEGDVVHFIGTFIRLRDGLNYMAYAEAHIPAKNITLQIQNYDYTRE
jgi:hypothetical protein